MVPEGASHRFGQLAVALRGQNAEKPRLSADLFTAADECRSLLWLIAFGAAVHDLLRSLNNRARLSKDDAMAFTRSFIESLVMRMQSAFLLNPLLSLTVPAAHRRFGVDEITCAGVLGALVDARVLVKQDGVYRRNFPRPAVRPAA